MCPLNDKNYILIHFELKFAGEAWSLSYIVIVDRSVCCGLDNFCNKQDHSGLHSAHMPPKRFFTISTSCGSTLSSFKMRTFMHFQTLIGVSAFA